MKLIFGIGLSSDYEVSWASVKGHKR